MKRVIGILLGLALLAGAGVVFGRGGGGGGHGGGGGRGGGAHGGGAHMSGGFAGHAGPVGTRTGMNGGFTRFTTGPTRFTTGPHPGRPIVGVRPVPPIAVRPGFPHHRVIVGGAVFVGGPFWYPPYPYPYPYPYYESPGYAAPAYTQQEPTYIEQGDIRYYCPDSRDYYPNVPTCPSPWMQVLPEAPATSN